MTKKWYVVYTKSRWEKKVVELLSKRRIEAYCPVTEVKRQWADRKKIILQPLFTSYVFVYATCAEHMAIKETNGIINFVYAWEEPAVIKDEEIQAIKNFVSEHENIKLEKVDVAVNDTVRIIRGGLIDREGNVISISNNKIKVSLPSLGYMMVAEVEKLNVTVIKSEKMVVNF